MILLFNLDLQSLLARATQNQGAGANPANPAAGANPAGTPPVNIPPPAYAMQINSGQIPFDISALTGGMGGAADPTAMLQMFSQNGYNPLSMSPEMQQMYWGPGQQAQLPNIMMANANLGPMANNLNPVSARAVSCLQQILEVVGNGRKDAAKAKEEKKQEEKAKYAELKAAAKVLGEINQKLALCKEDLDEAIRKEDKLIEDLNKYPESSSETPERKRTRLRLERDLERAEEERERLKREHRLLERDGREAAVAVQTLDRDYKDLKAGKKPEEREDNDETVVDNTSPPGTTSRQGSQPKVIKATTTQTEYTGTSGADILNLDDYNIVDGEDFYRAEKQGDTYRITLQLKTGETTEIKTKNIEKIQRDETFDPIDIVTT